MAATPFDVPSGTVLMAPRPHRPLFTCFLETLTRLEPLCVCETREPGLGKPEPLVGVARRLCGSSGTRVPVARTNPKQRFLPFFFFSGFAPARPGELSSAHLGAARET